MATDAGTLAPATGEDRARTLRTDRWWLAPLLTVVGLRRLDHLRDRAGLHAEVLLGRSDYSLPDAVLLPVRLQGLRPGVERVRQFLPDVWWLPYAALTLPFLLLFRLTCYYYRKAYYRAFWLSPPACAVAEPHETYTGETRFPLIFQNLHRYFFYAAVVISLINTYDAIHAFHSPDGGFGIGLGTVDPLVNVVAALAYTASCHSCRTSSAAGSTHFSKHPVRYRLWTSVSKLNTRHMQLAWITLGTLAAHRLLRHVRRRRLDHRPPLLQLTA